MTTPMSEERLAEIRAALNSVPAGPWWWRIDCGSPDLMTQHSGWLYLLGSEAVVREDGEPQADIIVRTEYPDAEPPRAPLMRSSRELGNAFKANPVVRFTEQSPTLVADLLAEVERLRDREQQLTPAWRHKGVLYDLTRDFRDPSGDHWRWLGGWDEDGSPRVVCLTDPHVQDQADPAAAIDSMAGLIGLFHEPLRPLRPTVATRGGGR